MIRIDAPGSVFAPDLLATPGGFLWWYVDLVDETGDGVVVIWSYGLPFLPGVGQSARAGRPTPPGRRPSVSVAIYGDGKLVFYLLQEYAPEESAWDADAGTWRFGNSQFTSRRVDGVAVLDVELDCAVPRAADRLRGRISARTPVVRHVAQSVDGDCGHGWAPMAMAGTGTAELTCGGLDYAMRGRVYHDGNAADRPLHELGIERWIWGRVPVEDGELVYWWLRPDDGTPARSMVVRVDAGGVARTIADARVEPGDEATSAAGLGWWRELLVTAGPGAWAVDCADVVDSGPFYMRQITRVEGPGALGRGVGEVVDPARVDLARHRPLVRMRVHNAAGSNSMWLPLFTGPTRGRVRRLVRGALPWRG